MNGVRAAATCDGENLVDDEVGLRAGCAIEGVCLVSELGVQGVTVLVGVNGDRADPVITSCTNNANGDFATVCDEDLSDTRHACQPSEGYATGVV